MLRNALLVMANLSKRLRCGCELGDTLIKLIYPAQNFVVPSGLYVGVCTWVNGI